MSGDYPDDTFTEADVLAQLEGAGLKYKNGHHYILTQCPTHEDKQPSAQIYKDDWFVNCHSGCGRYHITKAFPSLREQRSSNGYGSSGTNRSHNSRSAGKAVSERIYETYDLMEDWKKMPEIPESHEFKGIPVSELNGMGWRWIEEKNAYFIPYFSRSETSIPFAQYRYLSGDVRFRFLKDAKPTMYGTWNLDPSNSPLFLVEGASDAAVLNYVGVPWIAAPSAASGELVKALAGWCSENGIQLIYAGDNDLPGDKLKEALREVMAFRSKQPPKQYKDWGDFFVAEGFEKVHDYCMPELGLPTLFEAEQAIKNDDPQVQAVLEIFPGAEVLELVQDVAPGDKGATHNRGSH